MSEQHRVYLISVFLHLTDRASRRDTEAKFGFGAGGDRAKIGGGGGTPGALAPSAKMGGGGTSGALAPGANPTSGALAPGARGHPAGRGGQITGSFTQRSSVIGHLSSTIDQRSSIINN